MRLPETWMLADELAEAEAADDVADAVADVDDIIYVVMGRVKACSS